MSSLDFQTFSRLWPAGAVYDRPLFSYNNVVYRIWPHRKSAPTYTQSRTASPLRLQISTPPKHNNILFSHRDPPGFVLAIHCCVVSARLNEKSVFGIYNSVLIFKVVGGVGLKLPPWYHSGCKTILHNIPYYQKIRRAGDGDHLLRSKWIILLKNASRVYTCIYYDAILFYPCQFFQFRFLFYKNWISAALSYVSNFRQGSYDYLLSYIVTCIVLTLHLHRER